MKLITYFLLLTQISCILSAAVKKTSTDVLEVEPLKSESIQKDLSNNHLLNHTNKNNIQTNTSIQADELHRYFMANYYQAGNKVEKAHTWYNRLLNKAMPAYAYSGYIKFLHTLGQNNHIYTLMPKVETLLPNDPDIQLIFAQVLEQAGKEQESHEKVLKLSKLFPLNEEVCYAAAQIFIKRQQPGNAITTIDALINTAPRKQNTFIFHYSKAIALLSMDNKQQALLSVKKSIELQPRFDRSWLLYSLIEEQLGNTQEALRGYAAYLNLSGKKVLIELHVQHLKERFKSDNSTLKNEQQAILNMAIQKHASDNHSLSIKEVLTRFAHLSMPKSSQS